MAKASSTLPASINPAIAAASHSGGHARRQTVGYWRWEGGSNPNEYFAARLIDAALTMAGPTARSVDHACACRH